MQILKTCGMRFLLVRLHLIQDKENVTSANFVEMMGTLLLALFCDIYYVLSLLIRLALNVEAFVMYGEQAEPEKKFHNEKAECSSIIVDLGEVA